MFGLGYRGGWWWRVCGIVRGGYCFLFSLFCVELAGFDKIVGLDKSIIGICFVVGRLGVGSG